MATVTESVGASLAGKRFSWGAVFAGVTIAIVVHIVLGVLGVAIGASTINPMAEGNPVSGIAMGSGIYVIASALVALFAGGFTAGALASVQDRRDRTLHGLTTWAVSTILMFMLLTTAVGRIAGGTAQLVSSGLAKAGAAAAQLETPAAGDPANRDSSDRSSRADFLDLDALRQEAREILRQTGRPELQPEALARDAQRLGDAAAEAARNAARDPMAAERELERLWQRIENEARETLSAADQDAMVNVLASRTGMDEAQARETVQNWETAYERAAQDAEQQWQAFTAQAERRAREWGQSAADAAAQAAWWTFFVLVLSALAAALGANVGANRPIVQVRESATR